MTTNKADVDLIINAYLITNQLSNLEVQLSARIQVLSPCLLVRNEFTSYPIDSWNLLPKMRFWTFWWF